MSLLKIGGRGAVRKKRDKVEVGNTISRTLRIGPHQREPETTRCADAKRGLRTRDCCRSKAGGLLCLRGFLKHLAARRDAYCPVQGRFRGDPAGHRHRESCAVPGPSSSA